MKNRGASSSAGLRDRPDRTHEIYEGLLTVLMRLVFLLYAEEREMFPADDLFVRNYSIAGLFARLVEDEARHPDTMDQRYGAGPSSWPSSGIVYGGVDYDDRSKPDPTTASRSPPGTATCFEPDRFPFLEGRSPTIREPPAVNLPRCPDGTILRVLRNLLYLKEERLSYRSLEVEQIGSVYEAVMGYRVETATGRSVAIRPEKRHGAPVTIDLDELLATPATQAGRTIQEAHRPQAAHGRRARRPQCPHRGRPGGGARPADRPPAHARARCPPARWSSSPAPSGAGPGRTTRPGRSPGRS